MVPTIGEVFYNTNKTEKGYERKTLSVILLNEGQNQEHIVFFKGNSQYGLALTFVDHLAKAFDNLGYKSHIINLVEPDYPKRLQDIFNFKETIKLFIGINGWGYDLKIDNKQNLFDFIEIPFLAWHIDHPIHNANRIYIDINNHILSFIDETHKCFARDFVKKPLIKGFIPHGGCTMVKEIKAFEDREFDLVFFGTFGNLKKLEEKLYNTNNRILNEIVWKTFEEAKLNTENDLYNILLKNFLEKELEPDYLDHFNIFAIFITLEMYIRKFRRNHIISSIKDFPIYVCGNGWEYFAEKHENIRIIETRSFPETIEMMNNVKVVLNIQPYFPSGGHERIFYSMFQGAVCLSDSNRWLETQFKDSEDILFYNLNDEHLDDKLLQIFNNPDKLSEIAANGKIAAEENHTWEHRAKAMIELVEKHYLMSVLKPYEASPELKSAVLS